jgi:hypothetical protein
MDTQLKTSLELITKWEYRAHQRGAKFISSKIKREVKGQLPRINIITQGGENTGIDVDNLHRSRKKCPRRTCMTL